MLVFDGPALGRILDERGLDFAWLATKTGYRELTIRRWIKQETEPAYTVGLEVAELLGKDPYALVRRIDGGTRRARSKRAA